MSMGARTSEVDESDPLLAPALKSGRSVLMVEEVDDGPGALAEHHPADD
jgi:hypothetical protein